MTAESHPKKIQNSAEAETVVVEGPLEDVDLNTSPQREMWEQLARDFHLALYTAECPPIEQVLENVDKTDRGKLLEELIVLENGIAPSEMIVGQRDYLERFPDESEAVERAFIRLSKEKGSNSDATTRFGMPQSLLGQAPLSDLGEQSRFQFGDYEIIREIARGGMGIVFEAEQKSLNRRVALKMIRSGSLANESEIQRFYEEAKSAAGLIHPNIVPVYEVRQVDGKHYFTMAFIEGHSLAAELHHGPIRPERAAELIRDVARGVHFAHTKGVIHRDLKPGNILLDLDGTPKVADFGLAKQQGLDSDLTETGCILGTPSFMPPEQSRGEDTDALSDVYSLGAVLYTLLTNRPPFQAASAILTLQQVQEKDVVSPRQLNSAISQDLETICLKCLEKSPRNRYQSAEEFAEELNRYLKGDAILARPVGSWERGLRWCRRHPAQSALALFIVFSVALLLGGLHFRQQYLNTQALADQKQKVIDATEGEKIAIEKAVRTQQYFSFLNQVDQSEINQPVGWTWEGMEKIKQAANLDIDGKDLPVLRTKAASCLTHLDVRKLGKFAVHPPQAVLAVHPKGTHIAVAEFRARGFIGSLRVWLMDWKTRQISHVYDYSPQTLVWKGRLAPDGARSVAFSPDGNHLVVGTRAGRVHHWRLGVPDSHTSWQAFPQNPVDHIATTNDSQSAIFGSTQDPHIVRWDFSDVPREAAKFQTETSCEDLEFMRNGKQVLILEENDEPLLLDVETLTPVKIQPPNYGLARFTLGPSPDMVWGRRRGELFQLDGVTGKTVRTFRDRRSGDSLILAGDQLIANRQGTVLLTVSYSDDNRQCQVWNTANGELVSQLVLPGRGVIHAAWHPDGRHFALSCHGDITIYEVGGFTVADRFGQQTFPIADFDLNQYGGQLVSIAGFSQDRFWQEQIRWDFDRGSRVSSDRSVHSLREIGKSFSLKTHPTEQASVWMMADERVMIRQDENSKPHPLPEGLTEPDFDHRGDLWTIWDDVNVGQWNLADGMTEKVWSNNSNVLTGIGQIYRLVAMDRSVFAGGRDGNTRVLSAHDAKLQGVLVGIRNAIQALAVSADEEIVAAGYQQGSVCLFSTRGFERTQVLADHAGSITAVALSPEGNWLATAGRDNALHLYRKNEETGQFHTWCSLPRLSNFIRQLQFHPQKPLLIGLVEGESSLRVWDLERLENEFRKLGIPNP